jgi:predicted aldo/keto reductase-like oxidoreductase
MRKTSRRDFIQTLMAGISLSPAMLSMQRNGPAGVPTRPLGKTGVHVSIVGFGGWDCAVQETEAESIRLLHEAMDEGVTFFDNCWEYHNGRAEEIMGKALAEGKRREKVFLMTKICARDYEGARRHLEECLRRLRTDHVDLLQFHAIQYPNDPADILDPERGGMKAVLEARKAGKLRFIGFTGHRDPQTHLKMLKSPFPWDSVQMPLNILDAQFQRSFQKTVVPYCLEQKIGILGMKSLAGQDARLPHELNLSVELCRRYAMSLPVSTVICGMQNREELQQMIRIARDFKPLDEAEISRLLETTREPARIGRIEEYKNPQSGYGCSYHDRVLSQQT